MPHGTVSKRVVDAFTCPPGKDREFLWDNDLAGFGVAAFPSGTKVYVAQYRQHGRSRRTKLGEHGRITPEEARKLAKITLGAVASGADPVEQRRQERAVRTFREVAEEFLEQHVKPKRKPSTLVDYKALLARSVYPSIGNMRVVEIRRLDIGRLHSKMSATPYAANRAVALISSIWNWAAGRDEVAHSANPAKGLERNPEAGRERFLTSEEFAQLGDALAEGETVGLPWHLPADKPVSKHVPKIGRRTVLDPAAVAAIRLLVLTGARLREILDAKWEHVDLERGIIHLPDSKTGAKPIYLSAAAQAVLASIKRIKTNPYIIPGEKAGAPRADLQKPWAAVTKAAKLPGLRIHDLRHSFASFGAGASLGLPIIGKLLGHSQPATTARYAHLDADPMRRAVDTIGATISAAMRREVPENVIEIRARENK